jgi:hypothetical protein
MLLNSGLGTLATAMALGATLTAPGALALQSPWWENYDRADRYQCNPQMHLVLERNESQASLITGAGRVLLFRETAESAGVSYRNDVMRVILRGDELTLEQPPQRLICLRTDEV